MSAAQTSTSANKGVKRGLPETGLPTTAVAAQKLWDVARLGTVTPEAYASQFGSKAKASGGGWAARIATLRGFRLIRFAGKNIGLSELGMQLVNTSDPAGQIKARRSAVMNLKAYRDLVEAFDGTPLIEKSALAAKLQFEYGKTSDFAQHAAQAFIDSLKFAEMLDQDNIVRSQGIVAVPATASVSAAQEPDEAQGDLLTVNDPREETGDDEEDAAEIDRAFSGDELAEDAVSASPVPNINIGSAVTLTMTLDLSNFRAEEVVQILSALGLANRG
jgi:hypothetical protein